MKNFAKKKKQAICEKKRRKNRRGQLKLTAAEMGQSMCRAYHAAGKGDGNDGLVSFTYEISCCRLIIRLYRRPAERCGNTARGYGNEAVTFACYGNNGQVSVPLAGEDAVIFIVEGVPILPPLRNKTSHFALRASSARSRDKGSA